MELISWEYLFNFGIHQTLFVYYLTANNSVLPKLIVEEEDIVDSDFDADERELEIEENVVTVTEVEQRKVRLLFFLFFLFSFFFLFLSWKRKLLCVQIWKEYYR